MLVEKVEKLYWTEKGEWLFAQQCVFTYGVNTLKQLPPETLPEVAFVGRSNVGKSSLINTLTNQLKLARTSKTPGRTQNLNFFRLENKGYLVDLPGYGYADAGRHKIIAWNQLSRDYLKGRSTLKRVYILIDSRHGIKEIDQEFFEFLDKAAVSYQIILTKMDKISLVEASVCTATVMNLIKNHPAAHPQVLGTSSRNKYGIPCLKSEIAQLFITDLL